MTDMVTGAGGGEPRGAGLRAGEQDVHPSVLRLREVGADRCAQDLQLITATTAVVAGCRAAVLERRGLDPDGLGRTAAASVETETRQLAAAELQVAIGLGITEARTLVRAASAPADLTALVHAALARGEASWPLVRLLFESTTGLDTDQLLLTAHALLGTDPALAVADRLDPDGDLHHRPWDHPRFSAALKAEVTACTGTDPVAERARRARAYAARRVAVRVHDDGTATMSITGPAASVVAAGNRVDRAARGLRARGDDRTLDQLRCDSATGLLLYATIALTHRADDDRDEHDQDEDQRVAQEGRAREGETPAEPAAGSRCQQEGLFDEDLAPADMDLLARVVNGLPTIALQVIVPYGSLAGGFPLCARCSRPTHLGPRPGDDSARGTGPPDRDGSGPGRAMLAEVLGPHPFFITDGHARELALFPGTTLHRLIVDPANGRIVERTIATYRPDTDMRRQIIAADVYNRAPGSRLGAHAGELDHVTPYGWGGGPTAEANLVLLAKTPHKFKTNGHWHLSLGARRDLTITTTLGQVTSTRTYDYRTFLRTRHPQDLEARRDLANSLTYAALADGRALSADWVRLDWTDDAGQTYRGPSPTHPTLDDLLNDTEERDTDDSDAA